MFRKRFVGQRFCLSCSSYYAAREGVLWARKWATIVMAVITGISTLGLTKPVPAKLAELTHDALTSATTTIGAPPPSADRQRTLVDTNLSGQTARHPRATRLNSWRTPSIGSRPTPSVHCHNQDTPTAPSPTRAAGVSHRPSSLVQCTPSPHLDVAHSASREYRRQALLATQASPT